MRIFDLKLFQFLFLMLPMALVAGISYSNIILTIIVIYYIFQNFKNLINVSFYFKIFFLFIFYLIFISLIGETTIVSLETSLAYLRYGLFILAIPYIFNEPKIIRIFFYILFLLFIFLFLDLLFQFLYGKNFFGFEAKNFERVSGIFRDRQVAGSYALRLMPVILVLMTMIIRKNLMYKCILIVTSIGIILLSGERTSLFFFILFLFYAAIVEKSFKFLISLLFIILILVLIIFLSPVQKNRFFDHTINQLNSKNNINKYNIFSERHQYHYLTSYNMFKENILFGSGPNSFRHVCGIKKYTVENFILENNTFRAFFDGTIIFNDKILFDSASRSKAETKVSLVKNEQVLQTLTIPAKSQILVKNNTKIKKNDILFIKYIEYENGCNTHPHNFLIQILGETGLFGFLFYLYFLYKIISFIIKNLYFLYFKNVRAKSEKYMYLAGSCLINFFPFTPSGNFFSSWLCIIYSIPIGLLYYLEKNKIN